MKNSGRIFIGIMAAATAGVIIGMLIAPEKGEDLRRNLKNAAGDWKKKLSDLLDEGNEQYKSLKSSVADGVDELKNAAKGTKA